MGFTSLQHGNATVGVIVLFGVAGRGAVVSTILHGEFSDVGTANVHLKAGTSTNV